MTDQSFRADPSLAPQSDIPKRAWNAVDRTGQRYGRLRVVSRADDVRPEPTSRARSAWNCICDCGRTKVVVSDHLQQGLVKSCGCLNRETTIEFNRATKTKAVVDQTDPYRAAHRRVRKQRGRAALHPCHDCGKPAVSWSYNKKDPNELTQVMPWGEKSVEAKFSLDPRFYVPRCHPCHTSFDRSEVTSASAAV